MTKKNILFLTLCVTAFYTIKAQNYHPNDLEGLRAFLRQPSAVEGIINAQFLGLTISDTTHWTTNPPEFWVHKISVAYWNEDSPKRLRSFNCYSRQLAGILDCSKWTALEYSDCYDNKLTALNVSNCRVLRVLRCDGSGIKTLDLSDCPELETLTCSFNQLTILDLSNNLKLKNIDCSNNLFLKKLVINSIDLIDLWFLSCSYNRLLFSQIPVKTEQLTSYIYSPQYVVDGGNIFYQSGIDLSKEYIINGNTTLFSWYEVVNEQPITLSGANGIFQLDESHIGKRLRCKMLNATFPELSGNSIMTYEVTVTGVNNIEETESKANVITYPNPTTGTVYINANNIKSIEIFDVVGKPIDFEIISKDIETMGVSVKSVAGIYFIKVGTNSENAVKKLIIE